MEPDHPTVRPRVSARVSACGCFRALDCVCWYHMNMFVVAIVWNQFPVIKTTITCQVGHARKSVERVRAHSRLCHRASMAVRATTERLQSRSIRKVSNVRQLRTSGYSITHMDDYYFRPSGTQPRVLTAHVRDHVPLSIARSPLE